MPIIFFSASHPCGFEGFPIRQDCWGSAHPDLYRTPWDRDKAQTVCELHFEFYQS